MSSDVASTGSLARVEDVLSTNEEIHLSSFRSKEPSFPSISSLPSELLEVIFIHGARDYYDERGPSLTSHVPTWVNVSYVCQRWRDVALNCSTLWTYHFSLSLRWTEELLLRSKQAPLKISCSAQPKMFWWPNFLNSLRNHSERIQELWLSVFRSGLPDELFLQAPRLEILKITSTIPLNSKRLLITDAGTPVLRTIELIDCSLQWHLLNLSKLETLSIQIFQEFSYDRFELVGLLTAMCSMQNLTVLHLWRVTRDDVVSSGNYSVSHKIDLPCLALLMVEARLPEVGFLLSCIEIPLKTKIHLIASLEHDTPVEDYAPLSSFLAQRFSTGKQSSSSGPTVRSLIMYIADHIDLILSSLEWDCDSTPRFHYGEFNSTIHLQINFKISQMKNGDAQLHPITTDICRSLSLTNVQTLYVQGEDVFPWKFKHWRELFGCLDNLRYLKLELSGMPDLSMLSLVTPKPEESSDRRAAQDQDPNLGHTLVPALEKVELSRMQFLPDDVPARRDWMSEKSFLDVLSTRNIHRDQVIMNRCEVSKLYEFEY